MPRISQLNELDTPAAADVLVLVDQSTGQTKKVLLSDLLGIPDLGWTSAAETWTYSSWSSTTRIGVVTAPSDATTKYTAGMRIKITQSTGGTKYGIIVAVSATTITIFFPSGTTLNNEAISDNFYSSLKVPLGFPASRELWVLRYTNNALASQSSPTSGTWYNPSTQSLAVGKGSWVVGYEAILDTKDTSVGNIRGFITLSTANNSESDADLSFGTYLAGATGNLEILVPASKHKSVLLAAAATYYLNVSGTTGLDNVATRGDFGNTVIYAECAYL